MPVGAYVASALMAANIECDSGEDVDRFLAELARRGFAIRAEAGTLDVRTDGDGYEIRVWQTHQPSGVVVLKGHPQLGGRYCLTDGGDWPCATARGAIARLAEADR